MVISFKSIEDTTCRDLPDSATGIELTNDLLVNNGNRWNQDYVKGNSKKISKNIGVHTESFNGYRLS